MRLIYDNIEVSRPRLTKDGYLVADAHVARTGIQIYLASELGLDGDPNRRVKVYRPPEEVFSKDAMSSYAHSPVTVNHPSEMVDSSNWKQHSRGQTGDEVLRDGEFVRVPMMLMDENAINEWRNGTRELSMGYTMDLKVEDGVTSDGEEYEAVQTNLRMNHLALVPQARGGSKLRLGDIKPEEHSMSEQKLTTITVDGLSVVTTDAGEKAILKLQDALADSNKALDEAKGTHEKEMAAKDSELAKKDAEISKLKDSVLSDADLDQKVTDRADLIATARQIADLDYTGDSAETIRSKAVAAKCGQSVIDGKSADYISARFDILSDEAKQDPVRNVMRDGAVSPSAANDAEKAHAQMVHDKSNAWRGTEAQS